jgi:hypothetical protein
MLEYKGSEPPSYGRPSSDAAPTQSTQHGCNNYIASQISLRPNIRARCGLWSYRAEAEPSSLRPPWNPAGCFSCRSLWPTSHATWVTFPPLRSSPASESMSGFVRARRRSGAAPPLRCPPSRPPPLPTSPPSVANPPGSAQFKLIPSPRLDRHARDP